MTTAHKTEKSARTPARATNVAKEAAGLVLATADATAAAAGAVGGAAVNGVVGGVRGAASGVRNGFSTGRRSTGAAALTLAAIGVAGLVDWPLLVTVGGGALLVHELSRRSAAKTSPSTVGGKRVSSVASVRTSGQRRRGA
jgi:hypothetical protein